VTRSVLLALEFNVSIDELQYRAIKIVLILGAAFLTSRLLYALVKRVLTRSLEEGGENFRRRLRKATPNVFLHTSENRLRTQARVQTLISVAKSVIAVVVWLTAFVAVLGVVGLNVGTLLTSAGILGVALGFGAQNIVRDFLAGFFVVTEDQYGVGDVVDLGPDVRGTVERISLRSTSLRDVHGVVWHIPNGQIQRVGNKSQLWARAVLDVEVAYDTDIDLAEGVIRTVAEALAADPEYLADILEAPEVWGVENYTVYGMAIRVVVKTEPASQFGILRELRGRIADAFHEAGIDFGPSRFEGKGS